MDDEELRKEYERQDALTYAEEASDLQLIMGKSSGRRLIMKQLELCGIYEGSRLEPLVLAWDEGRRSVGRQLLTKLDRYCPDLYWLALQERRQRIENERRLAAGGHDPDEETTT